MILMGYIENGRMFLRIILSIALILSSVASNRGYKLRIPRGASECKGSGIRSLLNDALNESFDITSLTTAQMNVASETICASSANMRGAMGFKYEDPVCTLYGQGEHLDKMSNKTYFHPVFPETTSLVEVARFKDTYATPSWQQGFEKHLAVDGHISSDASMYHSGANTLYPWWIVDIGQVKKIHQVQIVSRFNGFHWKFHDIEIRVGNTLITDGDLSPYTLMSTYKGPYASSDGYVVCTRYDGVYGRFISIQRVTNETKDHLQIVDVNVFAMP